MVPWDFTVEVGQFMANMLLNGMQMEMVYIKMPLDVNVGLAG